jgi:hypothetical protein
MSYYAPKSTAERGKIRPAACTRSVRRAAASFKVAHSETIAFPSTSRVRMAVTWWGSRLPGEVVKPRGTRSLSSVLNCLLKRQDSMAPY